MSITHSKMNGCSEELVSLLPVNHHGLETDLYELTMAAAYFDNKDSFEATFELFVRNYPKNRSYLIAAGLEQAVNYLTQLHFTEAEIKFLSEDGFAWLGKLIRERRQINICAANHRNSWALRHSRRAYLRKGESIYPAGTMSNRRSHEFSVQSFPSIACRSCGLSQRSVEFQIFQENSCSRHRI